MFYDKGARSRLSNLVKWFFCFKVICAKNIYKSKLNLERENYLPIVNSKQHQKYKLTSTHMQAHTNISQTQIFENHVHHPVDRVIYKINLPSPMFKLDLTCL